MVSTVPQGKQRHKSEDEQHLPLSTRAKKQEGTVGTVQTENDLKGAAMVSSSRLLPHRMWAWSCQIYPEKPESLGRENTLFPLVNIRKLIGKKKQNMFEARCK